MTELVPRLTELHGLGVGVVLVGSGEPRHAADFVQRFNLGDAQGAAAPTIVTDPERQAYTAAGLQRSAWATFGPRAAARFVAGLGQGHTNRWFEGDALQQGGSVLVDADRVVVLLHRERSLGDRRPVADAVEAALLLAAETSQESLPP